MSILQKEFGPNCPEELFRRIFWRLKKKKTNINHTKVLLSITGKEFMENNLKTIYQNGIL